MSRANYCRFCLNPEWSGDKYCAQCDVVLEAETEPRDAEINRLKDELAGCEGRNDALLDESKRGWSTAEKQRTRAEAAEARAKEWQALVAKAVNEKEAAEAELDKRLTVLDKAEVRAEIAEARVERLTDALTMPCGKPTSSNSACDCCQRRWLRAAPNAGLKSIPDALNTPSAPAGEVTAWRVNDDRTPEQLVAHPPMESCPEMQHGGGECLDCGRRACPHGEPLHYHHDGCPACDEPAPPAPTEERNQCDGCQAGIPVDERGLHRMGKGEYPDYLGCQADKYKAATPKYPGACAECHCPLPYHATTCFVALRDHCDTQSAALKLAVEALEHIQGCAEDDGMHEQSVGTALAACRKALKL